MVWENVHIIHRKHFFLSIMIVIQGYRIMSTFLQIFCSTFWTIWLQSRNKPKLFSSTVLAKFQQNKANQVFGLLDYMYTSISNINVCVCSTLIQDANEAPYTPVFDAWYPEKIGETHNSELLCNNLHHEFSKNFHRETSS